jgi:hypothetical protein
MLFFSNEASKFSYSIVTFLIILADDGKVIEERFRGSANLT